MTCYKSCAWRWLHVAVVSLLAFPSPAVASPTTGAIVGRVVDQDTRQPLDGVTVVVSGPQGDQAALTDAKGQYELRGLPIGDYVVRFFRGSVAIEHSATVLMDQTVMVNARLPSAPEAIRTIAVTQRAPAIDMGSTRVGVTLNSEFAANVPNSLSVSDLLEKAPGATSDATGLVLSGGTGLENTYYLDGLNITSLKDGALGTNLFVPFLDEVEIISAGYGAEYGRALGGVVNMVTKSGSNEWHASAFSYLSPGAFSGGQQRIASRGSSLTGVTEPDYTTTLGAEVGGPIVKNKLFFWVGYAPEIIHDHLVQYANRFVEHVDPSTGQPDGTQANNPDGNPTTVPLYRNSYAGQTTNQHYAGKLTWKLTPEQTLSLSLYGIYAQKQYMPGANMDYVANLSNENTRTNDITARWTAAFFQRRWRLDATVGMHIEQFSNRPVFPAAAQVNYVEWDTTAASLPQFNPSVAGQCAANLATGFNPCPVYGYQSGGYGEMEDINALRLAGQLKSTNIFHAAGLHELKYGFDGELVQYGDKVWYSGTDGSRVIQIMSGDAPTYISQFRLPPGMQISQVNQLSDLLRAPYYQDVIEATTRQYNTGLFLQESYSPLSYLTVNLGVRWEMQRMQDYLGNTALSIYDNIAPRVGVIFDPSKEGRSKIFAHYGRYYESIPMNLAARGFAGLGSLSSTGPPFGSDRNPIILSGAELAVSPGLKGSYNDEVVLGGQYEVLRDLVIGTTLIYRWLGRAIEDTYDQAHPDDGPAVVFNPPGATRTYQAVQFTANKRFARRWFLAGSYTLSRLRGNYVGLYDADNNQLNPNQSTQYDAPGIMVNRNGPLPNDRPHLIRLDGYYTQPFGHSSLTAGLGFVGRSGQPLNALGSYESTADYSSYILPRGSMGRTPFVTRFDLHLAYRRSVLGKLSAEVFFDIFNLFNQRTVLTQDQVYTEDTVQPIPGGSKASLQNLTTTDANNNAVPVTKNPNFLMPTSYQAPISGRLGVRVMF
jgi:Carboxypeptidase regulatory-like domain